jgi:predicted MFS family arabinose efflux permease
MDLCLLAAALVRRGHANGQRLPYLMQVASERERNHAFSLQAGVMAGMGFAGAVVAGALPRMIAAVLGQSLATSPWPFGGVLWLAPLAYLSGVFVMWGASDVDGSIHDRQRGQTVPLRPLLLLAVVTFLGAASEGSVRALFNVYLDQALVVAPQIIGLVFGAAQLAALLIVLFASTLLQRRDARGVYLLALGGLVVVYCLMSLFAVPVVAALAYVGFFCMVTLAGPARNLFGQQLVERCWRATAAAIVTIGVALGWASMAAFGGYFAAQFGFSGLFAVSAGLAGLAALTLWGSARHRSLAMRQGAPGIDPESDFSI